MLKLEKARHSDVNITMRNKQRCFNRTLITALAIACGLHLFGAIIFHIHPFISFGDKILSPTIVEAEMNNSLDDDDWSVLAYLDTKHKSSRYQFAPTPSEPKLPSISISAPSRQTEYIKETSLLINPFLSIEEDWDYLIAKEPPASNSPPISVHVSGPLADIPLITDGTTEISPTEQTNLLKQPLRCVFEVQVEGKTGRIFWFTAKQSLSEQSICSTAETLLHHMRFQPSSHSVISTGEVEITISPAGGA